MKRTSVEALTVLRALTLSRVFLFLSAFSIHTSQAFAGLSMNIWAGLLLLMDLPLLICTWGIRPEWEDFVRAYALVWTLILSILVWFIAWGLLNAGLILLVNILIVVSIARPNSLVQSQSEVAP